MSSLEMGLLFPNNSSSTEKGVSVHPDTWRDLEVDSLLNQIFPASRLRQRVTPFFNEFITDPEILTYRQEVIEDFLDNNKLFYAFKKLEPQLIQFNPGSNINNADDSAMFTLVHRISELALYVSCTDFINTTMEGLTLKSKALLSMKKKIKKLSEDPLFHKLKLDLPKIQKKNTKLYEYFYWG